MKNIRRFRLALLPVLLVLLAIPALSTGTVSLNYAYCGTPSVPGYASVIWTTSGEPDPIVVWVYSNNYAGTNPSGPSTFAGGASGAAAAPWIYGGNYYVFELWSGVSGSYGSGTYLSSTYLGC